MSAAVGDLTHENLFSTTSWIDADLFCQKFLGITEDNNSKLGWRKVTCMHNVLKDQLFASQ